MKKYQKVLLGLLFLFIVIQFIPTKINQSRNVLSTDITKIYEMPKEVLEIFQNSCYDCHSNNTSYPWYNKLQPVAWILEHHVDEAKSELNFSEFGSYDAKYKKYKFKEIIEELEEDEMPLQSYLWMHNEARLSMKQKEVVINWVKSVR